MLITHLSLVIKIYKNTGITTTLTIICVLTNKLSLFVAQLINIVRIWGVGVKGQTFTWRQREVIVIVHRWVLFTVSPLESTACYWMKSDPKWTTREKKSYIVTVDFYVTVWLFRIVCYVFDHSFLIEMISKHIIQRGTPQDFAEKKIFCR